MISNYTKDVTVDTTGGLILEFDVEEIDSVLITPDEDIYIGFSDLSQAVFPLPLGGSFTLSHQDFKNQTLEKIYAMIRKYLFKEADGNITPAVKRIRVYAKTQLAASAVVSIHYLGGNR